MRIMHPTYEVGLERLERSLASEVAKVKHVLRRGIQAQRVEGQNVQAFGTEVHEVVLLLPVQRLHLVVLDAPSAVHLAYRPGVSLIQRIVGGPAPD